MQYTVDFKQRCLKTFLGKDKVNLLILSMDRNDHTKVRELLEDLSDITQYDLLSPIYTSSGATEHNSQLSLYRAARELYTEFMEQLINEIDQEWKKEEVQLKTKD